MGLLNIQVVKYSLINDIPERNLVGAKSLVKEALDINSNHLPTLLLAIELETIESTDKDHRQVLDFIRKALTIDPNNQRAKKKFDEIIRYQSTDFAKILQSYLKDGIQEGIKNAKKRAASEEIINKSQKLQEIFFPEKYVSANWMAKQDHTQASFDTSFGKNIAGFITTNKSSY